MFLAGRLLLLLARWSQLGRTPAAAIHLMQSCEYRQASMHIHNDGGQSREDLHGLRLW